MKQTFNIPQGCNKVTIEKTGNNIITTFEPEFKQGDVVTAGDDYVMILNRIDAEAGYIYSHCHYNKTNNTCYLIQLTHDYTNCKIRLATEEEKQPLFDAMKENGYQWNDEKLELEKIEWVPKKGERYWCPSIDGVFAAEWSNSNIGNNRLNNGFIFKTEQEAQEFFNKVKQLAKNK